MILPISHERDTLLRWPVVSLTIIAICLGVHLLSGMANDGSELFRDALQYYMEHPYLELDSEEILEEVPDLSTFVDLFDAMGGEEPDPMVVAEEQAILDAKVQALIEALDSHPVRRWGLTPADLHLHQLVSHMFLHIGWLHLLGNLFIFYLGAGPIEDVWGRPLFAAFFLSAGIFAAVFFVAAYPDSTLPMVGASGAVSGVVGAFLVRFWKVKIRFFYFLWFFMRIYTGTFQAAAWIMLPLWIANELYWAYVSHYISQVMPGESGGVAYLAHVGGFMFGALFALGVKALNLEERWVAPKIHSKIGLEENPVLELAAEARKLGNPEEAWRVLEEELFRNGGNRDAALALWDVALELEQPVRAAPRMMSLIQQELREGEAELALQHWDELKGWVAEAPVPPRLGAMMGLALLEREEEEEACALLRGLVPRTAELPPMLLLRVARSTAAAEGELGRSLAMAGLAHPALDPQTEVELRKIANDPAEVSASDDGHRPTRPEGRKESKELIALTSEEESVNDAPGPDLSLQSVITIPVSMEEDSLTLHLVDRGPMILKDERMGAVGAAEICEPDQEPYFVLDLFVDKPDPKAGRLRAFRCSTRTFDPRHLLPDETDPNRAFLTIVGRILAGSGAPLYPEDLHPFQAQPFATYASVEEYEAALLTQIALAAG
jgi:membrane associated rhomboid family serine protease